MISGLPLPCASDDESNSCRNETETDDGHEPVYVSPPLGASVVFGMGLPFSRLTVSL
jgi:hypothetical protein